MSLRPGVLQDTRAFFCPGAPLASTGDAGRRVLHPPVPAPHQPLMNIGIVGTGNVGATLGRRFADVGHSVAFGTRRPDSPEMADLARLPRARVTSQMEAAQSSDAIVLATP